MTTMTYEQKLQAFAQGKRLRRFRGMVRNPRDPTCDACGSVMPNHLWGLRDMGTGQDYFVGQTCLAALSKMLVIERPFVGANLDKCYERTRGGEESTDSGQGEVETSVPAETRSSARNGEHGVAPTNGRSGDIEVVENDEFVTVFVRAISPCGRHQAWGAASESRYRQVWQPDSSTPLVLRPTAELNPDAVAVCLARAQRMAQEELQAAQVATQTTPTASMS